MRRLGGAVSWPTGTGDGSSAMMDPWADNEGKGAGLSREIGSGLNNKDAKTRRGARATLKAQG